MILAKRGGPIGDLMLGVRDPFSGEAPAPRPCAELARSRRTEERVETAVQSGGPAPEIHNSQS